MKATFLRDLVLVLLLLVVGGDVGLRVYDRVHPPTPPAPSGSVDGRAIGAAVLAALPGVEVAGLQSEHDAMLGGRAMADVMGAGKTARHDAFAKLRAAKVAPGLSSIVAEGAEPKDATARAAWAAVVADMISKVGGK